MINIDHHPGNTGFGQINWFDSAAAACGEMVFDLVKALGVPLSREIATHIYLAILTDTGSFHYSSISPRTFESAARPSKRASIPVLVARNVYDSNNMGRLKLFGAVLSAMQIDPTGRIAIVYLDHEMAREAGGTYEDTEGLINLPLTVKEIEAVVFFKQIEGEEYRVSMRSKGDIDIGAVAKFGGGGHKNAAGCTVWARSTRCRSCSSRRLRRRSMDGLLIVDKPVGPTSHDVVARVRRALGERAHRPHRHARSDGQRRPAARRRPRDAAGAVPERGREGYDAVVRLGCATDTHDADGTASRRPVYDGADAGRARRSNARSTAFAGRFSNSRRVFSAKKIGGRRSYALAQDAAAARPRLRQGAVRSPPVDVLPHAGHRHRERPAVRRALEANRRAAADLLGRASTSARSHTISASGSGPARTSPRCGGRGRRSRASRTRCASSACSDPGAALATAIVPMAPACCRRCRRRRSATKAFAARGTGAIARPADSFALSVPAGAAGFTRLARSVRRPGRASPSRQRRRAFASRRCTGVTC